MGGKNIRVNAEISRPLTSLPNDPVPCLNNEPYHDDLKWGNDADQGSDLAAYYSRVALYGCALSGALADHVSASASASLSLQFLTYCNNCETTCTEISTIGTHPFFGYLYILGIFIRINFCKQDIYK